MGTCAWEAALRRAARPLAISLILGCVGSAHAAWSYRIDVLGAAELARSFEDSLSSNVVAALDLWTQHLAGGAAVEVELLLTDKVERAQAYSLTSGWVRQERGVAVYEQGLAYEIRTGTDPNGPAADLRILMNPEYAERELWFDPQPAQRWLPVPAQRTDAVSLIAHELGHALAFNGWWDAPLSHIPLDYGSTWDLNTRFDGELLYFTGAWATQLYGGPVPVTTGNNWHVGNAAGAGVDLLDDLMNGVQFYRGTRYNVSALDLAMLSDMGVALAPVPEPQTGWLLGAGLLAVAGSCRRLRPR